MNRQMSINVSVQHADEESIVQMYSFYMSPVTVLEYKHCREIPTKRPSSYLMEWQWSSYFCSC